MKPFFGNKAAHRKNIFAGDKLVSGNHLRGPAIIEQMDSTTVVHPGQNASVDRFGNILIEIHGDVR